MEKLSQSALDGADRGIRLAISMGGVMCLWTGMMKIADRGGLTKAVSKMLSPLLSKIMPDYESGSPAMSAVSANITAHIAALRQAAGSAAPYSILPNIWATSFLTLASGIILARIFSLKG